ncbi:MAG TPA: DNA-binding domain-containing protein [Microvirga sp.]|nr:DNA-binding domain-containing protein [Microvirga sp.]
MRLADRQRGFARALLDPELSLPPGLVGPDGEDSPKRFSVYRNNVVVGLIEALEAAFPAVRRIVGEEFFRAMARAYALREPPTSPILLDYGAGFPGFVASFEPAKSLPYLPDVARLERAWSEAYHAADAVALELDALAAIPRGRLAGIRLTVHPSLRIVRSRFPVLTIWRMNVGDGVPGPVDLDSGGEDVLVVRPAAEVEVRSMPPGGAALVTAFARGQSLTEAARSAMSVCPSFDLAAHLAALVGAGIFVGHGGSRPASRAAGDGR